MTDKITEIASVDEESKYFVQLADGRVFREPTIILNPDTVEKIRQGYMCIWCFEPLREAFPKECPLCTFPVSDQQTWLYGKLYAGIDIPPTPLLERLAEFDEMDARKVHDKHSSIVVPRSIP